MRGMPVATLYRGPWLGPLLASAALGVMSSRAGSWGTLTQPLMSADERARLVKLLGFSVAIDPARHEDRAAAAARATEELDRRRGPHPTHQFIAYQAWLMLQKDPAFADGRSGFPDIRAINRWDGVERIGDRMTERTGRSEVPEVLAPAKTGFGGAGADAEYLADGKPSPVYDGAYHYWNPWLQVGQAPKAAGLYYSGLAAAIAEGRPTREKAYLSSYMAHYVADACTPKHADAVIVPSARLERLRALCAQWIGNNPRARATQGMLTRPEVAQVRAILEEASRWGPGRSRAAAWWERVRRNIGTRQILEPGPGLRASVYAPSLDTAVASYMWAIAHMEDGKDLRRFGAYFDPFYFDGPLFDAWSGLEFALATPMSEHLMWETEPALRDFVLGWMASKPATLLLEGEPPAHYAQLAVGSDRSSLDPARATGAYADAAAALVKRAALEVHGAEPEPDPSRFRPVYTAALNKAVESVFTAFRGSITALRVRAVYRKIGEPSRYRITCQVRNLAPETAQLETVRLWMARDSGGLKTYPSWTAPAGGVTVSNSQAGVIRMDVDLPESAGDRPDLVVDVFGRYDRTPDSGWRRASVQPGGLRFAGSAEEAAGYAGAEPLDLAIVFDVTGSMQSSIDSVRDNTIDIVRQLKERVPDMRLSLVSFRDLEADKERAISRRGFSRSIDGQLGVMRSWKADGGGDTPEDQLYAIRNSLAYWLEEGLTTRAPTKVVVVITDAPAKSPDSRGNTFETIAALAEKVDPAHIYPIIVGSDATALAHANRLASLTGGKVLQASDGARVAGVLLEAVTTAVKQHGRSPRVPPAALFYGGVAAIVLGLLWLARTRRPVRALPQP